MERERGPSKAGRKIRGVKMVMSCGEFLIQNQSNVNYEITTSGLNTTWETVVVPWNQWQGTAKPNEYGRIDFHPTEKRRKRRSSDRDTSFDFVIGYDLAQTQVVTPNEEEEMKMTRRLVQVLVFDPDVRVPDEKSELYKSEEYLTVKTDEELKMEIDFKTLLPKHNDMRKKIVDEDKSETIEKDIYLKAIKMRDLEVLVFDLLKD